MFASGEIPSGTPCKMVWTLESLQQYRQRLAQLVSDGQAPSKSVTLWDGAMRLFGEQGYLTCGFSTALVSLVETLVGIGALDQASRIDKSEKAAKTFSASEKMTDSERALLEAYYEPPFWQSTQFAVAVGLAALAGVGTLIYYAAKQVKR